MAIIFKCRCGQSLQAREEHVGKRVRCPQCSRESTVPGPGSGEPEPRPERRPEVDPPKPREERVARRRDDPDEDRPARPAASRRRFEDDEDDEPRRRSSSRSRRDDDWEEDDRPRRRNSTASSGLAMASLVFGLLSFCLTFLAGLPAILFGVLGLRAIGKSNGRLSGKGTAIAGLVLGTLGCTCVPIAGYSIYSRIKGSVGSIHDQNSMKQIGQAMHNQMDDTRGQVPSAAIKDKNGTPLLSWRVALLPRLGQQGLYQQFRLDEPWDSPHNKALVQAMPSVYASTRDTASARQGLTYFRVFTGPETPFPDQGNPLRFPGAFSDGTSNTIMLVEAADPVPWTKPDELPFSMNGPLPKLGQGGGSRFSAVLWDGSLRIIDRNRTSDQTIRNAITPAGGVMLGPDW